MFFPWRRTQEFPRLCGSCGNRLVWDFDIVFYFDDGDVVLFGNEIRNGVDIINKSTDNTDTGYVIELVLDILGSEVVTQFFSFL